MGRWWRVLCLILLVFGMAGFGLCALFGGTLGLSTLVRGGGGLEGLAVIWFPTLLGGLLTWLCWLGFRALSRRDEGRRGPFEPPPPADGP